MSDADQLSSATNNSKAKTGFAKDAAAKVGIGKSHSLFTLVLVSIGASSLIASYVLIVGLCTIRHLEVDTIGDAAVAAARELSDIQVEHSSQGRVNLCDWRERGSMYRASAQNRRSIFAVRKTLEKIEEVSRLTHIVPLATMAHRDQIAAKVIETQLSEAVHKAASGKVLEHVKALLLSNRSPQEGALSKLEIKLGYIDANEFNSNGLPITLIDSTSFAEAAFNQAPNLVLVTAEFHQKNSKDKSSDSGAKRDAKTSIKSACAFIKPQSDDSNRSVFAISFPQGMPPFARSLDSLIKMSNWTSNGSWRESIGNDVPGPGSLASSLEPLLPEMQPGEALTVALYDWLKYIGPDFNPKTVTGYFNAPWPAPNQVKNQISDSNPRSFGVFDDQLNSCVAKDTGARDYAFMYQSNPSGVGQIALSKALVITKAVELPQSNHNFPLNSFPLFVDESGNCNIPGTTSFDKTLLHNFFKDLKATNLAALESFSAARSIHEQSANALYRVAQKQNIEQQELTSLQRHLNHVAKEVHIVIESPISNADKFQKTTDKISEEFLQETMRAKALASIKQREEQEAKLENRKAIQTELIQNRIEELKKILQSDEQERAKAMSLQHFASRVAQNAHRIQTETYDLCSNLSKFCRDGLFAITPSGYLLGHNSIFLPLIKAISESDFLNLSGADEKNNQSLWLKSNLQVVLQPENAFERLEGAQVGQTNLQAKIAETSIVPKVMSSVLIFDSKDFNATDQLNIKGPVISGNYPFANLPLPINQLLYYCSKAIVTGSSTKVRWSVLVRDFVAHQNNAIKNDSTSEYSGRALATNGLQWRNNWLTGGNTESPPIAGEFQIRTPLPDITDYFEDTYLTNPINDSQAAEIPPVPPDML